MLASIAGVCVAATLPFWIWPLDLWVQRSFFDPNAQPEWVGKQLRLCLLAYEFGTWPAYALGIGSAAVATASLRIGRWTRLRRPCLYLALCLALGPGLIVNSVFKDHWGRPRPRNLVEFGGQHQFETVWTRDPASSGSSFPSGHAAAGFYFLALVPLAWPRRGRTFAVAAAALGFGGLLGLTRIAMGAHFASDVLWSAGMCALTSAALFFALRLDRLGSSGTEPGLASATALRPERSRSR